jgi:thiosulfate/3-mercaptopyruvate sulfurtransferase
MRARAAAFNPTASPVFRSLRAPLLLVLVAGGGTLGDSRIGFAVPAPWDRGDRTPRPYPTILLSVDRLLAQPPDARPALLDARSANRFARGTIPGAISLPARELPADSTGLPVRLRERGVPARGSVVCFSDGAEPVEAGRLFWLLELAGYENVRVLDGGLDAWRAMGQTVERPAIGRSRAPTSPAAGASRAAGPRAGAPRFRSFLSASDADVRAAFGRAGNVLLDWRPESEWEAGHVPYSLAFPFAELSARSGGPVPPDSIRRRFERFGPRAVEHMSLGDTVIVFGDLGPADAPLHPYLACRLAGLEHVRNWTSGWSGWITHAPVPVVRVVETKRVESLLRRPFWVLGRRSDPVPVVFDVRGEADYRAGHLPGALSLPSHRFDHDLDSVLKARVPALDRARTPVLLYCYGLSCTRSRNCAALVARRNIAHIEWYREGIEGWRAAGLPLEEGPGRSLGTAVPSPSGVRPFPYGAGKGGRARPPPAGPVAGAESAHPLSAGTGP